MPKRTKDLTDRIEIQVTHTMRVKLIALGFLTQDGGAYSGIARNLLHQAIETAVAALSPERRKAYDEIMGNVEISEADRGGRKHK